MTFAYYKIYTFIFITSRSRHVSHLAFRVERLGGMFTTISSIYEFRIDEQFG